MMFLISKTSRMFLGLFSVWIPFLLGSWTRLGVCFQALNHCYLPSPAVWVGVKGAVPRGACGASRPRERVSWGPATGEEMWLSLHAPCRVLFLG